MRTLVVNAGSSSLKWSVIEWPSQHVAAQGNEPWPAGAPLELSRALSAAGRVDAVAHRVVHGGARFRETTRIDAEVLAELQALTELDPLHAPRSIAGIEAAQRALTDVAHFACFDTAFHSTLSEAAATYAIPRAWRERFGIRRFGFHGLSVAHAARRAPEVAKSRLHKLVVAHLGSGCSVTAVLEGKSIDTTMGFTPLEGLVMGTRSGDFDPGALLHLLRNGVGIDAVARGLERESGLLGVSELSADLRELESASRENPRAQLAIEVFVHSVVRSIGAMASALDGLDALIFTGGIGEHSARVRSEVCRRLSHLQIALDEPRNATAKPDADLSRAGARARVLVIEAREDLTMAREVAAALGQ